MATKERAFLIRTTEGTEYGPVDQVTLEKWADEGRVTAECMVRSSLVPRWAVAADVPFLKDRVKPATPPPPQEQSLVEKLTGASNAAGAAAKKEAPKALHRTGDRYSPAAPMLRLWAGLFDLALVLAFGGVVFTVIGGLAKALGPALAFYLGVAVWYVGALLYLTWSVGFRAQTVGQWYWGLMVVGNQAEPVFLGRAFVFALATMLFGVFVPLLAFILPSKRGPADLLSATRVIRTRIIH
jgi:uncharacterized RDD family membrane protein YckC